MKKPSPPAGPWTPPIPEEAKKLVVMDATADIEKIAAAVDFVFCAVDMKKDEIRALEEAYAKHECPVVSNNSAHRFTPDVPMVVPEINPEHLDVIAAQRKRLGTKRGFIAVKSNCSSRATCRLCTPCAPVRSGQGAGLHLSGHLRCQQNL